MDLKWFRHREFGGVDQELPLALRIRGEVGQFMNGLTVRFGEQRCSFVSTLGMLLRLARDHESYTRLVSYSTDGRSV